MQSSEREEKKEPDFNFRIGLLGNRQSGKWTLLSQLASQLDNASLTKEKFLATHELIGRLNQRGETISLSLYAQSASNPLANYRALRHSTIVLIVLDCSDEKSIPDIDGWRREVEQYVQNASVFIVGTKLDLASSEQARLFREKAETTGLPYALINTHDQTLVNDFLKEKLIPTLMQQERLKRFETTREEILLPTDRRIENALFMQNFYFQKYRKSHDIHDLHKSILCYIKVYELFPEKLDLQQLSMLLSELDPEAGPDATFEPDAAILKSTIDDAIKKFRATVRNIKELNEEIKEDTHQRELLGKAITLLREYALEPDKKDSWLKRVDRKIKHKTRHHIPLVKDLISEIEDGEIMKLSDLITRLDAITLDNPKGGLSNYINQIKDLSFSIPMARPLSRK